ncbi:MAG: hypothetical protein H7Y11_07735 [Armatimonadetes bacterium]|nr:hypothetical protein [Anaerolineae bacterium]
MPPTIEQQLDTLKRAARDREWNTLQPTLATLLAEIGTFPALEVIILQLNRHLPIFQRYHPDDATPSGRVVRELMISVVAYGFAPNTLPEFLTTEYPTPGSGQFVYAVLELCRAMQPDGDPAERFTLLASAVANAILAELTHYWYSQYPEEFERVMANHIDPAIGAYTDPDAARIPLLLWSDAGVAQRDTGAWLKVAYAIEKRLNPKP